MQKIFLNKIKMNKDDFFKINVENFVLFDIRIFGNSISFFCDNDFLKFLKGLKIKYYKIKYDYKKYFIYMLFKKWSFVVGVFLFALIIYGQTFLIKDIKFENSSTDSIEIEANIRSYLKKTGPFYTMDESVIDLSHRLKKDYSNYEWISLNRVGTSLIVETKEANEWPKVISENTELGDLVASSDGVIKEFKIEKGVPLIETNLSVKKGDILVSGDLLFHHDTEEKYIISPKGYVLAEVWEEKTVTINKQIINTEKTGKIHIEKEWNLFGINFRTKKFNEKYIKYDILEVDNNFSIFGIKMPSFTKNIYYYEKNDIITINNEETAVLVGESTLYMDYKDTFSYEKEHIISIEMFKKEEDKDNYYMTYFVKVYKNIAEFKRSIVDGE